ncbi:MAG: TRAP transporter large permease [Thermodesulfobacteriota bacterium]
MTIEPLWVGVGSVCILFVLLAGGVYVGVALGVSGVLGMIFILGLKPALSLLYSTFFAYGSNYFFVVVPLFVAMGLFAAGGEISRDSYDILAKWLGGVRGGLGLATVGAATLFGLLTGSSVVTSLVFGRVSSPEMVRHGYDPKIAYGLAASAGPIGMLIPPSVLAVIYALIAQLSVGKVLMGGVGAGLVMAFCLCGGLILLLTMRPSLGPAKRGSMSATWRERLVSLPKLWPAIVVAIIGIGGIYGGVFTVTEAAGVGTFVLFLLFLISKKLSRQAWPQIAACLRETVSMTAMVLLILVCAQVFSRMLILSGLAASLTDFLITSKLTEIQFVVAATLTYMVLGCFLDAFSILAITVPMFTGVINSQGIDPIWFGVLMIVATQIGCITPPVGLTVYAVKSIAPPEVSLGDIFLGSAPFFVALLIAQGILIALPVIITWLPNHIVQ